MKIAAGVLWGVVIAWSLLQLVTASGLLPAADAELRAHSVASRSVELVRDAYAECPMMRSLVARYEAGEHVTTLAMLEAAARCDERSPRH
jgi:hypothetical protein